MPKTNGRGMKAKGDRYEREIATHINNRIFRGAPVASRAPLSGGGRTFQGAGESDLNGIPDLHIEAKRTERFEPWKSMAQAEASISARSSSDIPVVVTRRSRMATGESLVTLRLDAFLRLYAAYLSATGFSPDLLGQAPPPPDSDLPLFSLPLSSFDAPTDDKQTTLSLKPKRS